MVIFHTFLHNNINTILYTTLISTVLIENLFITPLSVSQTPYKKYKNFLRKTTFAGCQ